MSSLGHRRPFSNESFVKQRLQIVFPCPDDSSFMFVVNVIHATLSVENANGVLPIPVRGESLSLAQLRHSCRMVEALSLGRTGGNLMWAGLDSHRHYRECP